jgi:myo-inositol-1(or 4)-monophosphatase
VAAEPDVDGLLDLAVGLAEQAGSLLLEGLGRARASVTTKTTATDMVTEMDRAAEQLIVAGLRAARPHDAVVGEEGTARRGTSGVRWIVDPLDGTTNYLYGLPTFAVSIAAEVAGRLEVGVVVDPSRSETWTAVRGRGAAGGGRRLRVGATSEPPGLSTALVGTGFSYDADRRARQAAVLATVLPRVRDIRRGGSAAIDLCWVAAGRLDAFYERGLQVWDVAAGSLVAAEAGARTGDLDGGPPSGSFTLAAPATLFEPLRELLLEAGAGRA